MAVLRNKLRSKYTQIANGMIADESLSDRAFRVLCYLASKPDGWNVNNSDVQKKFKINSKTTMANCWRECINSGWLSREYKDGNPKNGYDYILHEKNEVQKSGTRQEKEVNRSPKNRSTKKPKYEKTEVRKNSPLSNTKSIVILSNSNTNNEVSSEKFFSHVSEKENYNPIQLEVSEKEKKVAPKKEKGAIAQMVVKLDAFRKENGLSEMDWSIQKRKEFGNLKNLQNALEKRIRKNDRLRIVEQREVLENFDHFLEAVKTCSNGFWLSHATPSGLYSNFQKIRDSYARQQSQTSPNQKRSIGSIAITNFKKDYDEEGNPLGIELDEYGMVKKTA